MICRRGAEAIHRLGIISDAGMREFDGDCLVSEPETPGKAPQVSAGFRGHHFFVLAFLPDYAMITG
jgi:hypothetical protein